MKPYNNTRSVRLNTFLREIVLGSLYQGVNFFLSIEVLLTGCKIQKIRIFLLGGRKFVKNFWMYKADPAGEFFAFICFHISKYNQPQAFLLHFNEKDC